MGEVDSRKQTVAEWGEPFRKGVVAYLDEAGRPRGFLLVDTWGKVDAATELIAAGEPLGPGALASLASLTGYLFEVRLGVLDRVFGALGQHAPERAEETAPGELARLRRDARRTASGSARSRAERLGSVCGGMYDSRR